MSSSRRSRRSLRGRRRRVVQIVQHGNAVLSRLAGALFLIFLAAWPAGLSAQEEETGLFLLGGRPIGYYHQRVTAEDGGLTRSELTHRMVIARLGTRFTVTHRERWLEGDSFLRLEATTDLNGQVQRLEARAVAGGIEAVLENEGRVRREYLPVEGPVAGIHLASRAFREALGRGEQSLEYRLLLAQEVRVDRVEMLLLGEGERVDSLGRTHQGLLTEERMDGYPGLSTQAVVDPAGRLLYAHTSMGLPVEMVATDLGPEEAERLLAEGDDRAMLDVGLMGIPVRGLERLAGRLPQVRSALFRFSGENLDVLEEKLREGAAESGQKRAAVRRRGDFLEARLWAPGAPERIPRPDGSADRDGRVAVYTAPGFHLDLEDPRLDGLLAGAMTDGTVDLGVLRRRVYRTITRKSTRFGFAGTREILDSREGDCTEHGLLLVSLLRKAGIPSRLATGFVLMEQGFLGHAWTEVYHDGRWYWLDPSFPEAESRRLKIRLSVMDPARPSTMQMDLALMQLAGGVRAEIVDWDSDGGG